MAQIVMDTMDFASYLRDTDAVQKVRPAREWINGLIANLGRSHIDSSPCLPWQKTHDKFRFRPGEVTLWCGQNGHGKSLVTGMAVLSLIAQNQKACIASFEMKPAKTLERMARQFSSQRQPGYADQDPEILAVFRELYEQFDALTDGRLWLYDQQGAVKPDVVAGMAKYCANELGIGHIVIDSLMKCVAGEDDYNRQKDFVDTLTSIARDCGTHIHLVHHIRKPGSEGEVPSKADVKGSGAITDQVDNVLMVWRNKVKEKKQAEGKLVPPDEADCLLICDKQRNGEWEGKFALWWHAESQQFVASPGARALDFAAWPHMG